MHHAPDNGKIVHFPVRLAEAEVFVHEDLARVFVAWRQQSMAGEMPALHTFAPPVLGRWLAYSGVVEAMTDAPLPAGKEPTLRWRLAGSALCKLANRALDGTEVLAGWNRFEQATLRRLLAQLIHQHHPFLAQIRLDGMPGEARMEVLALPLLDPAPRKTVALMVFRPFFAAGRVVPGSLDMARLTSLRVLATAMDKEHSLCDAGKEAAEVLPLFTGKPA